jgi:hypothetical protein
MEQNNAQMLALVLCDHIAENWTRDMTGLFRCANAVEKARITAYYANGAELMHLRNHWRTGPICADLALLFRDQKDPESAIAFHEYAMEGFSGPDHRRDIMAQYEEFVETYRYFGMNQEAIALLQRAVQDALSWEMKRDVALFSGKLAHLMIQCKTGSQKDIDLLFDLQVRTLEEGNYVQELALALLEQAEYYSFKPFREEVFLAKVERAAALSTRFNDQAQIERLNRLERIIQLSRKKVAERLFYKLLRSVPEFEIRDARRTGKSGYHFICMHHFHSDSLHVVIQIGEAGQVDSVGFIAECPLPGGTVTEDMEHYARAWNKRKIYALNLINDVSLVQAVYSPDWTATDELCDLLVQFIKLWNLDQDFISFIANGEMSAEECIRKKTDIQEGTT